MSIRAKHVHFKNWAAVCNAFVEDSATGDESIDMNTGHTALMENNNKYYYYLCYVKSAMKIYTHGQVYDCSGYDDTELWNKIDELTPMIESKQPLLECSGNNQNVKTINGECILVLDPDITNIETPDTKVTSVDNHYKTTGVSAQATSGFATNVIYDAAGHITGLTARSITNDDISCIDASKICSGTISIDRLPHGALERLYVLTNRTAAMENTEISEGDTIMLTDEDSLMYFCVNNEASTFDEKYRGYTAGAATAVSWSGVTDKPTDIDGWGDRINAIESDYVKTSGSITGNAATSSSLVAEDLADLNNATIGRFFTMTGGYGSTDGNKPENGYVTGLTLAFGNNPEFRSQLAFGTSNNIFYRRENGGVWEGWRYILDSRNFSNFALPITGGTVNGDIYSKNYRTDGVVYIQKIRIENDNEINGYSAYNGGSATNNIHLNYISSGNVTACYGGGNVGIGTTTPTSKLHAVSSTGWGVTFDGGSKSKIVGAHSDGYGMQIMSTVPTTTDSYIFRVWQGSLTGASGSGTALLDVRSNGVVNIGGDILATGALKLGSHNRTRIIENPFEASGMTLADTNNNPLVTVSYYVDHAYIYNYKNSKENSGISFYDDGRVVVGQNFICTGIVSATDLCTTSDNRLKDFVSDIYVDFESLKQIPKKYYYWKDKSMGEDLQLGTSAQELAKIYPECVSYDEKEDKYSVSYQKLSIVALAAIDKLYDEIKELKSKLND